jgi:beta-lactamase regulating signal transducer with metallopeptidase domain
VLIAALLLLDLILRPRVRAVVRYTVWLLVFVKLLLPPTLAVPTGIAYYWPRHTAVLRETSESVAAKAAPTPAFRQTEPEPALAAAQTEQATAIGGAEALALDAVAGSEQTAAVQAAIVWQAWVFLAWLGGLLALSICLLRRFRYVSRLVQEGTAAPASLQGIAADCAAILGLRRCPQLRLSEDVPGPVVCGLLRPVVLMPVTFANRVSEERLRTVLVHELAHIKRADLWVNFVQTLLLVVYFYHPLLWLVNAIVRRLREQAVDETVLVALDADAGVYSTTLIDLAEMTFSRPILGLRLIGIAESRKALEGRIRHMMTRPKPRTAKIGVWGALMIAAGAAVLLPMARGQTDVPRDVDPISAGGQQFEGKLIFNETLPVGLTAGSAEHPKLVDIESVRFETAYGNAWLVVVRLGWLPVGDATWRLRAELLDDQGQVLRHPWDHKCVFTTIAGPDGPMTVRSVDLQLLPMQFEKRRHATGFRLHLEPWSESPFAEGRTIDISVVEPGGGSPVPGAVLVVDSYHETGAVGPRRTLYTTDSQGRCTVRLGTGMLVSPLTIRVQKEGFAAMAKVWSNRGPSSASRGILVNLPQRHVFEMVSATAIGGVVQDVNGALIETGAGASRASRRASNVSRSG